MFNNRQDAGRKLAAILPRPRGEAVVIALPRGGVPVAAEICRHLDLPIELALVRKIGAPGQPELALGAIVDGDSPRTVINREVAALFGMDDSHVRRLGEKLLPEIARRRKTYLGTRKPISVTGKTAYVVDDGVATGASMRAALRSLRDAGARRLILALPVAPRDTLEELAGEADETCCLTTPEPFHSVGAYYGDFSQLDDDEVVSIISSLDRH